jgi:hypothetical protein
MMEIQFYLCDLSNRAIYTDYVFDIILALSSNVLSVECQSHKMSIKESDFHIFLEYCQCLQIRQKRVHICIMSETERECQSLSHIMQLFWAVTVLCVSE